MNDIYKEYGNTIRDMFIEELGLPIDAEKATKEQLIKMMAVIEIYMPVMDSIKAIGIAETRKAVEALIKVYQNAELIANELEKKH